jgi:glutamine amidotransferase
MAASHIVLPGVGAYSAAMNALHTSGLRDVILNAIYRQTPLLGICLGMQLLFEESHEFGVTAGLGVMQGQVISIPVDDKQKLPNIGWRAIKPCETHGSWAGTLLSDNHPEDSMYFLHSFMVDSCNPRNCIADCDYGELKIISLVTQGQLTGCQFHPEKSGPAGLKLLRRFICQ